MNWAVKKKVLIVVHNLLRKETAHFGCMAKRIAPYIPPAKVNNHRCYAYAFGAKYGAGRPHQLRISRAHSAHEIGNNEESNADRKSTSTK